MIREVRNVCKQYIGCYLQKLINHPEMNCSMSIFPYFSIFLHS